MIHSQWRRHSILSPKSSAISLDALGALDLKSWQRDASTRLGAWCVFFVPIRVVAAL